MQYARHDVTTGILSLESVQLDLDLPWLVAYISFPLIHPLFLSLCVSLTRSPAKAATLRKPIVNVFLLGNFHRL